MVRPNIRKGRRELVVADVFGAGPERRIATGRPEVTIRLPRRVVLTGVAGKSSRDPQRLVPVPGMTPLTLMARPLRDLDVDVLHMSWDLAVSDLELL